MSDSMILPPDQPIHSLTVSEFESLITETVRRVLQEELHKTEEETDTILPAPATFLDTFGSWDDPRPSEAIVAEIYESRTISNREASF